MALQAGGDAGLPRGRPRRVPGENIQVIDQDLSLPRCRPWPLVRG
jgi:hypothetical protein